MFEIKNNFIPKKIQEEISQKFIDPSMELGRNGKMTEPALEIDEPIIGTEDPKQKPELALEEPSIIGQIPVPNPGIEEETYDN